MIRDWSDILKADNAEILAWAETRRWAREMAACGQDAGWHAEGDVWTHTRMVYAELERLPEWPGLDRETQLRLLFSAIFHDSGKPATTFVDEETGRTRSPRHALAGTFIARRALRELDCPVRLREDVAALARWHGRPPWFLEKPEPEREVIRLSWLVSNKLLYLLALADTRGRKTLDTARAEDTLHLWKQTAEEQGCFETPYTFVNDQARFLFFQDRLSSLHYTPREDWKCTVTMMSGLPGAGKDTWLAARRPELPVVALDALREELDIDAADANQGEVIQAARERCREHLRAGRDFAFNATNTTARTRKRWIDLFADYGARIEIVYLEPPFFRILTQNKERAAAVPERVIAHLMDKLEPPTLAEAHGVLFGS